MPAEALDRAIDDALHALRLREVGAHGEHAIVAAGDARHLACSGVQRRLGAPAQRHATAFRGQRLRAGEAEAAARSGHDRNFVSAVRDPSPCII